MGKTLAQIAQLLTWDENWNGYAVPKSRSSAVLSAVQWAMNFFLEVEHLGWVEPSIAGGPDGGVMFEWWYGQKKLNIHVDEWSTEYMQVWGTDVDALITDGDIESVDDYQALWLWLKG